jgi:hypothetical protein
MTVVRIYRPGAPLEPQRTETTVTEVEKVPLNPDMIVIGTGNGPVRIQVGDQFPSRAGGRLIVRVRWHSQGAGVFYYEAGKFYGQDALYFWKDSWMEAFQTGAHWARGGALIARIQVELCMGIMAGNLGTAAHWALTATDVLHMLSEVDIIGLIQGLPKLLKARRILKAVAPQVYDKLFAKFLDQMLENIGESLATAAAAHFVGRAIGRLGRHVPGQLVQTAKDIALWAGTFVAIRVMSLAGLAANDLKRLAVEMRDQLKKFNIVLSDAETEALVKELYTNKVKVQEAFQLIQGVEVKSEQKPEPPDRWRGRMQ